MPVSSNGYPSGNSPFPFLYTKRQLKKFRSHGEQVVIDVCGKSLQIYTKAGCTPCFEFKSSPSLCEAIAALPEVPSPCAFEPVTTNGVCDSFAAMPVVADPCA